MQLNENCNLDGPALYSYPILWWQVLVDHMCYLFVFLEMNLISINKHEVYCLCLEVYVAPSTLGRPMSCPCA